MFPLKTQDEILSYSEDSFMLAMNSKNIKVALTGLCDISYGALYLTKVDVIYINFDFYCFNLIYWVTYQ